MICLNCKRQMPDDAPNCPNCGAPVMPEVQVGSEIRFRRWQRWFFYVVFIVMFLGAVGFAVKVYADNTTLLNTMIELRNSLVSAQGEITNKDTQIQQTQGQISQIRSELTAKEAEIAQKTTEAQQVSAQKDALMREYDNFKANLSATSANVFNLLVQLGVGLSNDELMKIPVADFNLDSGTDTDGDGLSDLVEVALGTNPNNPDTDGDGYTDKAEILAGYNPLREGRLSIDLNYANNQKGKILLQVEGNNEAWYVSPSDGKRYFLGRPMEVTANLEGNTATENQDL
jgi:hypothetical protein